MVNNIYNNNFFSPSRLITNEVLVGDIPLGAGHPVRIQSMTSISTRDTKNVVKQCIRIIRSGVDFIRLTTPTLKDAENLVVIKQELRKAGYNTPLIADVHFNPKVAEMAAAIVEKVRINPGNFVPSKIYRKKGKEAVREKLVPLLDVCKKHHTAIRIGVNHGSLSELKLEQYGDTPEGMVYSALEYLDVCEEEGFNQIVFSMKASNTRVMIQAYRLLIRKMTERGSVYPLHLGVTEAGEGEDGRIKSAVGIGSLLSDGIGDTIRVSLTEEPEFEVPVAIKLSNYFKPLWNVSIEVQTNPYPVNLFEYKKQFTETVFNIGGENVPIAVSYLPEKKKLTPSDLAGAGYVYKNNKWYRKDQAADFFFLKNKPGFQLPPGSSGILNASLWKSEFEKDHIFPLFTPQDFQNSSTGSELISFILIDTDSIKPGEVILPADDNTIVFILKGEKPKTLYNFRKWLSWLHAHQNHTPVIFNRFYDTNDPEMVILAGAAELGGLFADGLGNGLWLHTSLPVHDTLSVSFGILQASRVRTTKTEFISCPSCGRTLFNIQEVAAKVRARTGHLKGLRIAVMGCIVNGPGEMADADYGYVGAGPDKISLYKKHDPVKKNLPADIAVDELIQLIKENGDWVEPQDE